MLKESEEMRDCTFQPSTSRKERPRGDYQKLYDRLYKDGETKNNYLKQLAVLKEYSEQAGCTFRPQTVSAKNQTNGSLGDTFERLYSD